MMKSNQSHATSDEALFQVPDELLCPITHSVFRNPVITTLGNVYEDQAIRTHLRKHQTDPLTNQTIQDATLTPVYLLRSKAKQYATTTAVQCLTRVLDRDCEEPAKFLRRACDVCDEADVLDAVPKLSSKIISFAAQHRGDMHDVFLLILFATDLAVQQHHQSALAVFSNLLRLEPDRPIQSAIIKRCLGHCWLVQAPPKSADTGLHRRRPSSAALHDTPHYSVPDILSFIQEQRGLCAADFVTVLEDLGVAREQLITICQGLISSAQQHAPQRAAVTNGWPSQGSCSLDGPGDRSTAADVSTEPDGSGTPVRARQLSGDLGGMPAAVMHLRGAASGSGSGKVLGKCGTVAAKDGGWHGAPVVEDAASGVVQLNSVCARLAEALAVVPKLLTYVERDVREDMAAKFAVLEREIGMATQDDGENEEGSVEEAGKEGVIRLRGQGERRRSLAAQAAAVGGAIVSVVLPGFVGRVFGVVPVVMLLARR